MGVIAPNAHSKPVAAAPDRPAWAGSPQTPRLGPLLLFCLLAFIAAPTVARAQPEPFFNLAAAAKQPVALDARLYAVEDNSGGSGIKPLLLLHLKPAAGYYAYAHIPQPGSKPTDLKILSGDGQTPLPGADVIYPPGEKAPDILDSSKIKFLYRAPTPLFVELPPSAAGAELNCKLSLLACSEAHCLPVNKSFTLAVPALPPDAPRAEDQPWWPEYQALRGQGQARTDEPSPVATIAAGVDATGNGRGSAPSGYSGYAAPAREGGKVSGAQSSSAAAAEISSWTIHPRSALPGLEVKSLGMALFFGLLAGFILNFMPCMLPVIGLKLTAFIAAGGIRQGPAAIHSFRAYWLFFSGGVICWFLSLAALAATLDIIWGQAFQNGFLVLGMILVVFSLALSTFGFYTLPIISLRGGNTSPHQAFVTGFLLTCLTTPCSGPLLGGVLAWTFRQGPEISSLVLAAVGMGMVAPYLFLVAFPTLSRYCPRPGRWLARLEILVGFFLLLTTSYLVYLLPKNLLPWAVILLAAMTAAAAMAHCLLKNRHEAHWKAFALSVLCLVAAAVGWRVPATPAMAPEHDWTPFSVAEFKENWGKKPILIDFTADWCANCKVLEKTVLTRERLAEWAERYDAVFIQADITHDNPAAQAMLQALDSASIPVVALFPADSRAASPLVLRDLFTSRQIENAVSKTFNQGIYFDMP